jgi:hypothetical protein
MRISRLLLTLTIMLCCFFVSTARSIELQEQGMWSAKAINIHPLPSCLEKGHVSSPDKKFVLEVQDAILKVQSGKQQSAPAEIYLDGIAEIGWAANSEAIFITRSDGGWVGSWYTRVVFLGKETLSELDVTKQALENYEKNVSKCPEEVPNVAAIGWIDGTKTLLIVVSTPNHSSCPDMGNFEGYLVTVPSGDIKRRYGEAELQKEFKQLIGKRLSAEQ